MAEQSIIQNRIRSLGQSQADRISPALDPAYAQLDERSPADYLRALQRLSKELPFYQLDYQEVLTTEGEVSNPPGENWSNFFPFDEANADSWLQSLDETTTPHLGLLLAFLQIYQQPQALMNQLTARHQEFYYRQVLQMHPAEAQADRAHVVVELKKGVEPQLITPDLSLSAGKGDAGLERFYRPVRETVINHSEVASLRSVYLDDAGLLRYAPIANSLDGLGTVPKKKQEYNWSGFGHANLPLADVGFAFAAPVLHMVQGLRTVSLSMTLNNTDDLNASALENAFSVFITGEKSWLGPYVVTPELDDGELSFSLTVTDEEGPITGHTEKAHGSSFTSDAPVMQVLLNSDNETAFAPFQEIELESVKIDVEVQGLTSIELSNDFGTLNPEKKFTPFGSEAKKGARLVVKSPEAFSKKLSSVDLKLGWTDVPANLATHYANYGVSVSNTSFTAHTSFSDGAGWQPVKQFQPLFKADNAEFEQIISFAKQPSVSFTYTPITALIYTLVLANSTWSTNIMNQLILGSPTKASTTATKVSPKTGEMVLSLNRGFLHKTYRKKYVENVVEFSKARRSTNPQLLILEEPVVPAINSISLDYQATSGKIDMTDASSQAFADDQLSFFHVGYFGQMREHQYIREQFDHVDAKAVPLFLPMRARGELLIGINNLQAGDSISLLMQLAEGSADPDLFGEQVEWSVLCDNYWKTLEDTQVVLDTTNQLLRSGLYQFLLPPEATTTNSILPAGLIWLRASVANHATAVCRFVDVRANAIETKFDLSQSTESATQSHLATSLPAKSIVKFSAGLNGVKSAAQPYASYAGAQNESDTQFNTRVSEHIRHKSRCVTPWDYERMVLANFPKVHKAKCIPHARPGSWSAPGNVRLVLIPNLNNQNAVDPLQPRVDSNTLSEVTGLIQQSVGPQTRVHVSNPSYQPVEVSLQVRFHQGFEFNFYRDQLAIFLQQTLSPWAFADAEGAEIEFGGALYDSNLLKAVEDLAYVDFVSDFSLATVVDSKVVIPTEGMVRAARPDVILVSSEQHQITELST